MIQLGSIALLLLAASNSISHHVVESERKDMVRIGLDRGIDIDRIAIGGIKYGMEERSVLGKLGTPLNRTNTTNCLGSIERLRYPGLVIDLQSKGQKKYVTRIDAIDPKYTMDRGAKVGDSIEKATKLYAPDAKLSDTNRLIISDIKYGDIFLVFESNSNLKIVKISIVFEC
jgi:hypothetical protein